MTPRGKVLSILFAVTLLVTSILVIVSSSAILFPAVRQVPQHLMEREPGTGGGPPGVESGPAFTSRPLGTRANGTDPVVVIPIEFTDVTHNAAHDSAFFDSMFNAATGQSVNAYYTANSYGGYHVQATVTPWVQSSHSMSYYGQDGAGVDDGTGPVYRLTTEAVTLAAGYIDFSRYDRNGDGVVDHVVIVHAGAAQESSSNTNLIWSHRWGVIDANPGSPGDQPLTQDGVQIYGYITVSEDSPIGVVAHEYGHDLGLPDLYDTDGSSQGAGIWDLMAGGSWNGSPRGTSPAELTAWSRARLQWLVPVEVTAPLLSQSIRQLENNSVAFRLTIRTSTTGDEYFLVENREKVGYDSALPGGGLLIWHADDSMQDNDNDAHRLLSLEEQDGEDSPKDATDAWSSNPTGFGPETVPNSDGYGNIPTGWKVRNIGAAGVVMTADLSREVDDDLAILRLNGAFAVAVGSPVTLTASVKNQGERTETNVNVTLRVFLGPMEPSAEVTVPGSVKIVPSLAKGAYANLTWSVTPTEAGRYIVDARVNLALDEIPENNERLSHFQALTFLFHDDIESGAALWNTPGQLFDHVNRWEILGDSDPLGSSHSPTHAWRFGNYSVPIPNPSPLPYHLLEMSAPVNVPAGPLYLVYYQRYNLLGRESPTGVINASDTDNGYIEIAVNGGPWSTVAHFYGQDLRWRAVSVNLTSYFTGPTTVQVRFNATASVLAAAGGWWIDDVMLLPTNFSHATAVIPIVSQQVIEPGAEAVFTFKAVNIGDFDDVFRLVAVLPAGWTAMVVSNASAAAPVDQVRVPLAPDGEATLQLQVRSPAGVLRGTVEEIPVTLVSEGDGLQRASFTASVTIADPLGLGGIQKYAVWLVVLAIALVVIIVLVDAVKSRKYRGGIR